MSLFRREATVQQSEQLICVITLAQTLSIKLNGGCFVHEAIFI